MTTNSDTNLPAQPVFVRCIPPRRDEIFRSTAASTSQVRTARNSIFTRGSQCFKDNSTTGIELRKCAKCKSAWYCSKECQKQNWHLHKAVCHDVERGTSKLIKTFVANPVLRGFLEVCLTLDFDLVNKPRPDTPLMARVDVGLEPSDITVFYSLYTGLYETAEPKNIEGMLQINAVTPAQTGITPHPHRLLSWRQARDQLCAEGKSSIPVVIVEFICNASPGAYTCVLPISSVALTIAKEKQPFEIHSRITGHSYIPMSPTACLESINTHIRADTHNQLLLRTSMREEDRDVIRAAGRGDDTIAVQILEEKMARERIYCVYKEAPV